DGNAAFFLDKIPVQATHLFVGGSTGSHSETEKTVEALKKISSLPVILFPGDVSQITHKADGILFLSLLSGDNPEYLIGQQRKAVAKLQNSSLEIIPTAYILIDGGKESAVERVSKTKPMPQNDITAITETALAGRYSGKRLIYLEAGSGAVVCVNNAIIQAVSQALDVPVIVGGGINSKEAVEQAYNAGATMVVIGTAFEDNNFKGEL
ncbi:MAG: phosphoglycerol geranylgeranyltransferase, partial [Flavobacteriaceae bacterium]